MQLQGLIMGLREGLEAFLIVAIMLQYLAQSKREDLRKQVYLGAATGIFSSALIGGALYLISDLLGKTDPVSKLWESGASFIALMFVTTFIFWMIKNGKNIVSEVRDQMQMNFSKVGLFSLAFFLIVREGAEIAIFTFAGKYALLSVFIGLAIAIALTFMISKALIKVNLKVLFGITLFYLILQAGFLFGYSIHEGLSSLSAMGILDKGHAIFNKAYNLSETVLNHKEGVIGLPLYVLFGWYSKPEWIQFIVQHTYTISLLAYWYSQRSKKGIKNS